MNNAVLIIDDEEVLAKNLHTYLSKHGYEVRAAHSGEEGVEQLSRFLPNMVLLDYNLGDTDGLAVLKQVRDFDAQIKVILMTGHGNVQVAVDAMKAGAYDYLSKPLVLAEVKLLLDKALSQEQLENRLAYYQQKEAQQGSQSNLLGKSAAMLAVKEKLRRIAELQGQTRGAPAPAVLIGGETGTGKQLVARALHFGGARREKPFVEINCASIPAHLMESELFGFERGAFTDAKQRKLGLVETADGGTLFLDEIGEMDLALQAKLLKLLEDRKLRRLGGLREQEVDIQVVSATNRYLPELVKDGRFRSDLFFRLRQIDIQVPPLRERGEDVLLLANAFLTSLSARYGRSLSFDEQAEYALRQYSWPGNVRELKNVIEQSIFLIDSESRIVGQQALVQSFVGDSARMSLESNLCMMCVVGDEFPEEGVNLERLEHDLVAKALNSTRWNITRAAKLLCLTRDTLRYRIEKYQLHPPG